MTNLLRADFRRLFKSRAFYICTALLFIAGTALPLIHYITMHEYPQAMSFDMYFTVYALIAVIALAAFSALFVGADYSDGTIRNKLVAGARRGGVYLSNLTVQTVTGLIVSNGLAEPEFYDVYFGHADGSYEIQQTPDPNYISGTKRTVLMEVNDLNPGAQAMRIFTKDGFGTLPKVGKLDALYDLAIIVLTTGAGILFFKKKDLK